MQDRIAINDDITVGAQPSKDELAALADEFEGLINLRAAGEEDQPMDSEEEDGEAERLGLAYHHIPVPTDAMREEQVDQFRRELAEVPEPVYVHCKSGKRSGAFAMMDQAVRRGYSGEETLQKAEEMGFECDTEEMEQFVKGYVDAHRKHA